MKIHFLKILWNIIKKEWLSTNFIKFDLDYDDTISSRTNKVCEGFHSYLNRLIEIDHPKQSLFVEQIKTIALNNYNKYIENLVSYHDEDNKKNLFYDYYHYLKNYLKKNKSVFKIDEFFDNENKLDLSY